MQDLVRLARQFEEMEPWNALSEADLVTVPVEDDEICFCSAMGALGEVFALQVYIGPHPIRFSSVFPRVQFRAPATFSENRGASRWNSCVRMN